MKSDIPKIYFRYMNMKRILTLDDDDLREFEDSLPNHKAPKNHSYLVYPVNDNDFVVFIDNIPNFNRAKRTLRKRSKLLAKVIIERPFIIMYRLANTLKSLWKYSNIDEGIFMIPPVEDDYTSLMIESVIEEEFEIIDKRFDPKTGEGYYTSKPKFEFDDVYIEQVYDIDGDDVPND